MEEQKGFPSTKWTAFILFGIFLFSFTLLILLGVWFGDAPIISSNVTSEDRVVKRVEVVPITANDVGDEFPPSDDAIRVDLKDLAINGEDYLGKEIMVSGVVSAGLRYVYEREVGVLYVLVDDEGYGFRVFSVHRVLTVGRSYDFEGLVVRDCEICPLEHPDYFYMLYE